MLDALQTNQCKTSLSLCENTLFLFIFKMLLKLNMNLKPADGAQTFNALIKWSLTLSACACPTVLLCALSVTQQCEITHWWFRLNVIQHCFTRLDSLHMPDLSVSVRLVVSGEKRGSRQQFPLRVLAHYPEVKAHAWPLPAWPPSGEQSMLSDGSHVLVANNPTSCPRSGERPKEN